MGADSLQERDTHTNQIHCQPHFPLMVALVALVVHPLMAVVLHPLVALCSFHWWHWWSIHLQHWWWELTACRGDTYKSTPLPTPPTPNFPLWWPWWYELTTCRGETHIQINSTAHSNYLHLPLVVAVNGTVWGTLRTDGNTG